MLALIFVGQIAAPALSNPTATATGSTTATGTVDTTKGEGTLYYYTSENSSESAATIKASGSSQSVTVSGEQNVSVTGLTAETTYYIHYVHDDASSNESNVVSSAAITTPAVADDATGGWITYWQREQKRREKERKRLERERAKAKKLQDEIEREAALLELHIAEETARKAELARINRIAARHQAELTAQYPAMEKALAESLKRQTFSTMERLEREMRKAHEEEEFLIMAVQILVNQ